MTTQRRPTADRQREIADAALALIARDGLGKFTSATLALEVGLTNGALFRHFAGMDQIVTAAIDRAEEVLFEHFPPAHEDPLERLGAFVCDRIDAMRKHPGVLRIVYSNELAQAAGEAGAARVREFKRRSLAFIRGCLQEASERGMLIDGVAPKDLTVVVTGCIMAMALAPEVRTGSGARAQEVWATIKLLMQKHATGTSIVRGRRMDAKENRP